MTNTLKTLTRRILGCPNPYAGYVEACDAASRRWAIDPVTLSYHLRRYYADDAFVVLVETSLKEAR